MRPVRAVINESIRLFPPVPVNVRSSNDVPIAFPATASSPKYYLPPGSQVIYYTMLVQRRHDLWGEDADEFKPSRWLDPECIKRLTDNPFMFVPFHAGPRIVSLVRLGLRPYRTDRPLRFASASVKNSRTTSCPSSSSACSNGSAGSSSPRTSSRRRPALVPRGRQGRDGKHARRYGLRLRRRRS
jgi:hypothetical protein